MRPSKLLGPVAVVAGLALLASACSSGQPESAPPDSPTTTGTPGASQTPAGPGSTPSSPTPSVPPTPAGPPSFTKILKQPVDGQHIVTQHRKYLVTRGSDEAGTTTVTDRASKRTVVKHVPPAGFVAQSPVVIDDRWALIEEIRDNGPSPQIRAYRYDLTTGKSVDLAAQRALPPISEPEIGAAGGTFAYSSTDAKRRSCLVVAELATLKARTVSCVADPGYFADPVVSSDSVTFSEITAPQTARRCKRLLTAPLAGGAAGPVVAAKNCIQWSGASLRGATVWSEVGASDPDQYQSTGYVREKAGATVRSIGPIVTDTIVACGNWIHWEVRTVTEGVERFQLQRWQPGIARPQRVYATPPDAAITPATCQDGSLIFEVAHLGAGAKYTEALAVTTT
ncbi:hypothetical protein [Kribbella sp. CA-293567]|uniref:hypothetical protein n=1 Tax=Kribbella sp. CA-293567 TaxID=3002436 RepID=UPI0022DE8AE6|nr:hypothetical protein [Kribbella sp. CA-293567]WBQ08074.1 hypothetical protein OX958_15010 [Kribbella sp. CA-293567]